MMNKAISEHLNKTTHSAPPTSGDTVQVTVARASVSANKSTAAKCCSTGLWGCSPPPLPADTPLKRRVDAIFPRSGLSAVLFFAAVITLLNAGSVFSTQAELVSIGVASLAAGTWCSLNFWRCRHAHCVVTGFGWLALAGFVFIEAGLGSSLIHGDEGLVFLAVLLAGFVFEAVWIAIHGTNAITPVRG